jgi:tetratricopeptide (TPR) repeat protein
MSNFNPIAFILDHINEDKNIQIALLEKCKSKENLLGKVYARRYNNHRAPIIWQEKMIDAELAKLRDTPLTEIPAKKDVHAEIKKLCEEATTQVNNGRYPEAMTACVKIIALDSRNKEAYYLICRAQAESKNRKSNAALGIVGGLIFLTLEKLSTEPDVNKIYFAKNRVSLIFYYLKNFDQAVEYATEMIQGNQNAGSGHLSFSHYVRAKAYLDQGKFALAIMDCAKALELSGTFDPSARYIEDLRRNLKTAKSKGKEAIFESIKQIESLETQMTLLEKCLDPTDPVLGKIFWDPTFRSCSLESGTLKMVKDYHASLQKQLKPSEEKQPKPDISISSTPSILFPNRPSVEPIPAAVPTVVVHALQNNGP